MSNPLVAQQKENPDGPGIFTAGTGDAGWGTGIGIAESINDISSLNEGSNWVETGLAYGGAALEVVGMAVDPIGTLLSYGLSWLIEHVEPLKEALDWFAGDPDGVKAYGETWANVSKAVTTAATQYNDAVKSDTAEWTGQAGDAYRQHAAEKGEALGAAAELANTISSVVTIMGEVVSFVREFVRDLVSDCISRLITYALEAMAPPLVSLAWVVPQAVAFITKTVGKIADIVQKLVKTISNVAPKLAKMAEVFGDVMKALGKMGKKAADGIGTAAGKVGKLADKVDVAGKLSDKLAEKTWKKVDDVFGTDVVGKHNAKFGGPDAPGGGGTDDSDGPGNTRNGSGSSEAGPDSPGTDGNGSSPDSNVGDSAGAPNRGSSENSPGSSGSNGPGTSEPGGSAGPPSDGPGGSHSEGPGGSQSGGGNAGGSHPGGAGPDGGHGSPSGGPNPGGSHSDGVTPGGSQHGGHGSSQQGGAGGAHTDAGGSHSGGGNPGSSHSGGVGPDGGNSPQPGGQHPGGGNPGGPQPGGGNPGGSTFSGGPGHSGASPTGAPSPGGSAGPIGGPAGGFGSPGGHGTNAPNTPASTTSSNVDAPARPSDPGVATPASAPPPSRSDQSSGGAAGGGVGGGMAAGGAPGGTGSTGGGAGRTGSGGWTGTPGSPGAAGRNGPEAPRQRGPEGPSERGSAKPDAPERRSPGSEAGQRPAGANRPGGPGRPDGPNPAQQAPSRPNTLQHPGGAPRSDAPASQNGPARSGHPDGPPRQNAPQPPAGPRPQDAPSRPDASRPNTPQHPGGQPRPDAPARPDGSARPNDPSRPDARPNQHPDGPSRQSAPRPDGPPAQHQRPDGPSHPDRSTHPDGPSRTRPDADPDAPRQRHPESGQNPSGAHPQSARPDAPNRNAPTAHQPGPRHPDAGRNEFSQVRPDSFSNVRTEGDQRWGPDRQQPVREESPGHQPEPAPERSTAESMAAERPPAVPHEHAWNLNAGLHERVNVSDELRQKLGSEPTGIRNTKSGLSMVPPRPAVPGTPRTPLDHWREPNPSIDPKRYTVEVHGSPNGVSFRGQELSAKELAEIIKGAPGYKPGAPVRLLSCNTGADLPDGSPNFAQQLSKELGVEVLAPKTNAWVDNFGNMYASESRAKLDPNGPDGVQATFDEPGQWASFHPDGTQAVHDSPYPPGHEPEWVRHGAQAANAEQRGFLDRPPKEFQHPGGPRWSGIHTRQDGYGLPIQGHVSPTGEFVPHVRVDANGNAVHDANGNLIRAGHVDPEGRWVPEHVDHTGNLAPDGHYAQNGQWIAHGRADDMGRWIPVHLDANGYHDLGRFNPQTHQWEPLGRVDPNTGQFVPNPPPQQHFQQQFQQQPQQQFQQAQPQQPQQPQQQSPQFQQQPQQQFQQTQQQQSPQPQLQQHSQPQQFQQQNAPAGPAHPQQTTPYPATPQQSTPQAGGAPGQQAAQQPAAVQRPNQAAPQPQQQPSQAPMPQRFADQAPQQPMRQQPPAAQQAPYTQQPPQGLDARQQPQGGQRPNPPAPDAHPGAQRPPMQQQPSASPNAPGQQVPSQPRPAAAAPQPSAAPSAPSTPQQPTPPARPGGQPPATSNSPGQAQSSPAPSGPRPEGQPGQRNMSPSDAGNPAKGPSPTQSPDVSGPSSQPPHARPGDPAGQPAAASSTKPGRDKPDVAQHAGTPESANAPVSATPKSSQKPEGLTDFEPELRHAPAKSDGEVDPSSAQSGSSHAQAVRNDFDPSPSDVPSPEPSARTGSSSTDDPGWKNDFEPAAQGSKPDSGTTSAADSRSPFDPPPGEAPASAADRGSPFDPAPGEAPASAADRGSPFDPPPDETPAPAGTKSLAELLGDENRGGGGTSHADASSGDRIRAMLGDADPSPDVDAPRGGSELDGPQHDQPHAPEPEIPQDVKWALDAKGDALAQDYLDDPDFRLSEQDRQDFRDNFPMYARGFEADYHAVLPEMRAALEAKYPREQYPEVHEITDEELLAIRVYSEHGYKELNRALRETDFFKHANAMSSQDPMARALSSALNRLPSHEGWVRRNIGGRSEGNFEDHVRRYAPGKMTAEQAYSSSSHPDYSYHPDSGVPRIRMMIHSKSAVDIDFLSGNKGESEYLFGGRSYFRTLEAEVVDELIDGKWEKVLVVRAEQVPASEITPEMLDEIGPRLSYEGPDGEPVPIPDDLLRGKGA
ncbi:hypothetical protein [Saccharopolyspora sp. NPDC002686]|uniref:WXG100-like domain-containing protein n=1 Tax=Saccharopolyspora sp. NPDC002686 TaxID=3154541 RepID=UPI003318D8CA